MSWEQRNADFCKAQTEAQMAYIEAERMVAKLQDENVKLRELVLHMYTCMGNVDADGNHECFSCEYEGAGCDFADSMRDLGIEVC